MHQTRLFVMCDSQVVRKSLSVIFASESNFFIVGESGCCRESVEDAQKVQPDAILVKIDPGDNALGTLKLIKEACPYTKIFIFIDGEPVEKSLIPIASEVDGFLSRAMLPRDLVKAVDLTCRTGVFCLPAFLKRLIRGHDHEAFHRCHSECDIPLTETEDDKTKSPLPLTPREVEIYELITKSYSNKEIGKRLFISQPTVKSHVSSILRKLGLSNRTELLFYEMQNKYTIYSLANDKRESEENRTDGNLNAGSQPLL